MSKTIDDRRQFWRAVFNHPVQLSFHGGVSQARLVDISLKGALLDVDESWSGALDEQCEMQVGLTNDVIIVMTATVVHVSNGRIGLRCDRIDLDSITHLRRLVELNAGDPVLLEREIGNLVQAA
ncbi:MAG TPA: PilZ domain-containing protein [Rhodocyclaceae bacterium]|nr:PilZ domain-containing protein [Rhodocyclaceae bacterium]